MSDIRKFMNILEAATTRKKKYTFTKVVDGDYLLDDDSIVGMNLGRSVKIEEEYIDGHHITAIYDRKTGNCIAMWYTKAKIGSKCLDHVGNALAYYERDTNYPYEY